MGQFWTPLFSLVRFITTTLLPLFVCHDLQQVLELVLGIFDSAVTTLRPRGVEPRLLSCKNSKFYIFLTYPRPPNSIAFVSALHVIVATRRLSRTLLEQDTQAPGRAIILNPIDTGDKDDKDSKSVNFLVNFVMCFV